MKKKPKYFGRDVSDTAFSIDRLFVWAISISGFVGLLGMILLSAFGRPIPPQIQSATMFCLGAIAARIERRTIGGGSR